MCNVKSNVNSAFIFFRLDALTVNNEINHQIYIHVSSFYVPNYVKDLKRTEEKTMMLVLFIY